MLQTVWKYCDRKLLFWRILLYKVSKSLELALRWITATSWATAYILYIGFWLVDKYAQWIMHANKTTPDKAVNYKHENKTSRLGIVTKERHDKWRNVFLTVAEKVSLVFLNEDAKVSSAGRDIITEYVTVNKVGKLGLRQGLAH